MPRAAWGDELGYLKTELDNIVSAVRADNPALSMRFALVVYRDQGDAYVTRQFGFTDDLAAFKDSLSQQQAAGGGDTPEAVDQALADAMQLSWREGNVARRFWWNAPTPQGATPAFFKLRRRSAQGRDQNLPVAASGVDNKAEYWRRLSAEWTLARYLFLTDDPAWQ